MASGLQTEQGAVRVLPGGASFRATGDLTLERFLVVEHGEIAIDISAVRIA